MILSQVIRLRPCLLSISVPFALLLSGLPVCPLTANAQEAAVEGYVTSVAMPEGFEVNREHVAIGRKTSYGVMGDKADDAVHASADGVQVGAFVRVTGAKDGSGKGILADSVLFRDDWDKKLAGFGVVERVLTAGAEPVFQADGYRIRVVQSTDLSFAGSLKTLADVGPNTWVYYKGKRDGEGVLVAARAKFVPARGWPLLGRRGQTHAVQEPVPAQGALMDADGRMESLRAKVRYGDSGGYCGWHRLSTDQALQGRVLRIGERLVPAYQRALAADDPAKIWFRFYVVGEDKIRDDMECNAGLILMPSKTMERIASDDQIAALLANGIAYYMQLQSAQWITENRAMLGAQLAADALDFVPAVYPAVTTANLVIGHEIDMRLQEQRGRIALALMADAGYDPWQAPEAWRRVAPKSAPKDWETVKYPNRGGYQLGILNLQYSRGKAAVTGSR